MIIWLTGGSSGLGLHTAQQLVKAGHIVVAGARSFHGDQQPGLFRLPLDVTDDAGAKAFAEQAMLLAGPPDALVQCAGILMLGSCEETRVDEYRRILETDFLGMVRMNSLVLPIMREKGKGRIIMFSSINGLLGIPFQSAYTAAKHAVEGYAECLSMECKPFGIEVCLIEPGDHRSGSDSYRYRSAGMTDASPYAAEFAKGTAVIHRDEQGGSDPDKLGRKIAKLLGRRHLPLRKRIASPDQRLAVALHRLLPGNLNSRILRSYYLGGKKTEAPAHSEGRNG